MKRTRFTDNLNETTVPSETIDNDDSDMNTDYSTASEQDDSTPSVTLLERFGDFVHRKRVKSRKNKKHKVLRRIMVGLFSVIFIAVLGVFIWNAIQLKTAESLVDSIDNTYTKQETGLSNVQKLGALLTIHDSESYDWVMNNVEMTPTLKRMLFTPDSDGVYRYMGTPISDEIAPTYELVEVQYSQSTNPLSYLAVFNVTLQDGKTRSYFITCSYSENVLTAFHIY